MSHADQPLGYRRPRCRSACHRPAGAPGCRPRGWQVHASGPQSRRDHLLDPAGPGPARRQDSGGRIALEGRDRRLRGAIGRKGRPTWSVLATRCWGSSRRPAAQGWGQYRLIDTPGNALAPDPGMIAALRDVGAELDYGESAGRLPLNIRATGLMGTTVKIASPRAVQWLGAFLGRVCLRPLRWVHRADRRGRGRGCAWPHAEPDGGVWCLRHWAGTRQDRGPLAADLSGRRRRFLGRLMLHCSEVHSEGGPPERARPVACRRSRRHADCRSCRVGSVPAGAGRSGRIGFESCAIVVIS